MDTPKSKKPMSRDEVACFVELLQNYTIIYSKETNAVTNKQKEDAWISLTAVFNAKFGGIPKKKEQLKLKWDNLKKAARKRTQQIRVNNFKTGGGKPDYMPPDEILEKVANILGATCTGFEVPFGGDGVAGYNDMLDVFPEENIQEDVVTVQLPDSLTIIADDAKKRKMSVVEVDTGREEIGAKFLYGMPTMAKALQSKGKKKKVSEDGRLERNLAIANYYNKKSEKLELENKQLKNQEDIGNYGL